jgi:sugar-specific transcriptional regulator TrmB
VGRLAKAPPPDGSWRVTCPPVEYSVGSLGLDQAIVGATAATAIITAKESAKIVPRTTFLFNFFTSFLHQLISNSVPISEKQLSPLTILKHGLVTEVRHSFRGEVAGLGEEPVRKVLRSLGLTEKEAGVYIFLAKHGVQRSGEIGKRIKTDRSEVYRILKSLQSKGLVEATLEAPTRFTAVPFEIILDSFIKAKRDEAASVETAKKELLSYFERFGKLGPEPVPEKFVVIEGSHKIYPKILQMIKETKNQLSAVATVPGLLRADQFGIFDAAFTHPLKSKIQFRFLTDLSEQNLNAVKTLLKRAPKTGFNFKGRNPELGLQLAPRMVIRDDEEIIFFITPRTDTAAATQEDLCLWTNCKTLVQAFVAVFEDLWNKSTNIEKKIDEIETGKPTPQTYIIIDNAKAAKKTYDSTVYSAKEEIIMMTSSAGLIGLCKNMALLKECAGRGVSIRIMAPLTSENLKAAQQLSDCSEVKHAPIGYLSTTLVDGEHFFQFKNPSSDQEELGTLRYFENTFYTTDYEYVYKMKIMLNDIWKNALFPSAVTLESTGQSLFRKVESYVEEEEPVEKLTEKDVLSKIITAQKIPVKGDPSKYTTVYYGSIAQAVIHPPDYFVLPDMMIWIFHNNKQSSFGAEDMLVIYLRLETPFGYTFMPVAHITDNPKSVPHRKAVFAGTPAAQNIQVVKRDELQVRVQGNTLFAGWTVQIPLLPPKYTLPPSGILFEGYGEPRTGVLKSRTVSGRKQTYEYNGFSAFVTFFHPLSKYAGPGTDGILLRDVVFTGTPPSTE